MPNRRHILIVINPAAGTSSYEKKLVRLEKRLALTELRFTRFFTEHDSIGKLRTYIKNDASISEIIVMGGDGTLNFVVNEAHDLNIPIAIVSNGTGNDSVKSLHGELDFQKQVEIAIHGELKLFDLGICNDRYFVNGVGIGFDGEVVIEMIKKGDKQGSHIDYLITVLKILAGFKEQNLRFYLDSRHYERKIFLMTISNGTTFGGGFILNPFAKTNDGKLDICIINEVRPALRFWHLPKLKTGKHYKIRETEFYMSSEIMIEQSDDLVAHLDGEYIGHPPFKITIEKEVLQVRSPA